MVKEEADDAPILNPMAFIGPLFRTIVTIAIAVMGAYLFGMIGSMSYPGIGAIAGALIGFVFFGLLTCCLVGSYKDCLPDINALVDPANLVPTAVSGMVFKHGRFTLIVTVHRLEGVQGMGGFLPWSSPDTYVSIECGTNPIKRTCVKGTGKFEEQFRLTIEPRDEHIVLKALDQDVFGAQLLGYCNLDIDEDIVGHGFPQEQSFKLEMGGKGDRTGGKTVIVLSFDYTEDYPPLSQQAHVRNFPTMAQRRKERHARSQEKWQSKDYGACQHLEKLAFSTDVNATVKYQQEERTKMISTRRKKEVQQGEVIDDPESTHPQPNGPDKV